MASHEVDHTASATRRVLQSMPQVKSAKINLARNDQTTHSKVRMVSPLGLNQAKSAMRMWTWHRGTLFCHTSLEKLLNTGDPTGTRTPNRLLRRQMLYPVELWGLLRISSQGTKGSKSQNPLLRWCFAPLIAEFRNQLRCRVAVEQIKRTASKLGFVPHFSGTLSLIVSTQKAKNPHRLPSDLTPPPFTESVLESVLLALYS